MRDAHLDAVLLVALLVVGVGLDGTVHEGDVLPRSLRVKAVGERARRRAERRQNRNLLGGDDGGRREECDGDNQDDGDDANDEADESLDLGVTATTVKLGTSVARS